MKTSLTKSDNLHPSFSSIILLFNSDIFIYILATYKSVEQQIS